MKNVVCIGRDGEQRMGPSAGVWRRAGADQVRPLSLITHQNP